jgi:dipeptidyl aminopeptidase/acylaminoacyl peptidase
MLKTIASLATALLLSAGAYAQPAAAPADPSPSAAAPFPIRDYMRFPDYAEPVLSPNGKYLAALVPLKDRVNLAVIDLEARKSNILTSITAFDVINPRWVGNDRLVFSMGLQNSPTGPGQFDGGGLFMVSRDGKESRVLSPTFREMRRTNQSVARSLSFLATLPDNDREILVSGNLRAADSSDVYRLDVTTGKTTLVTTERPPRVGGWVLDRQRVPRVAISSVKDELESIVHFRESESAPWTELARISGSGVGEDKFVPLAFAEDNETLLVASNAGRDTMAVFKYDPKQRKLGELVAGHPRYDMGSNMQGELVPGLVLSLRDRLVIGYRVDAERLQPSWTSETWARLQAMVDSALPGRVNLLQRTESDRTLVTSYSDRASPEYLLLDEGKKTLEPVVQAMSWLTDKHLVEQRPFLLKTRDGLEIPSYYFLPRNHKPGDKLPTVVHIHGGPFARADRWGPLWAGGFGVAEAQLLASRGYAVVLPNFRVTPGLGRKIYQAGFNAIGRQMSEDHEDAAKWAVDQGFADPQRLCISGASYGGYATLQALAKTPDLFKCGIAGLSVTDLDLQLSSTAGDTAYNTAGIKYWRQVIGEDKAPGTAKAVSPVHQASKMKAAVFFYAGADDIRTPLEQTTRMVSALQSAGNPPKAVVIKKEEGHGFGKLDNRIDLYEKILEFLDQQIGSKSK